MGHPARTRALLPLPHMFFNMTNFYTIVPLLPIVIATFSFRVGRFRTRTLRTGEGIVKMCGVKNACMGDGEECAPALDDAFGIR